MTGRPPEGTAQGEAEAKGECVDLTDLGPLASLARSSEDHEAYRAVASRENFRVGLVVNAAPGTPISFRMEVLLQILAKDSQPKVAHLERVNRVLDTLAKRGYALDHHDSCWVMCEREVAADDVERECRAVVEIILSQEGGEKRGPGGGRESVESMEV
jgi:hypothetical protein